MNNETFLILARSGGAIRCNEDDLVEWVDIVCRKEEVTLVTSLMDWDEGTAIIIHGDIIDYDPRRRDGVIEGGDCERES